jgi:hypothetical protein
VRKAGQGALVVRLRAAVVDLQQAAPLQRHEICRSDLPAVVGVVDGGHAALAADRVDVELEGLRHAGADDRRDGGADAQAVEVDVTCCDLLAVDEEHGAGSRGLVARQGQEVVVSEGQEVVAGVAIPGHDLVRR